MKNKLFTPQRLAIPFFVGATLLLSGTLSAENSISDNSAKANHFISQQKQTYTGIIKDQYGEPVIGANISIVGTTHGTTTDVDGKFSISANKGATIKISYLGYDDQLLKLAASTALKITLQENTQDLEEVVVVGYGTQKKANLTGAVSSVSSKTLQNRPITNLGQGLQGTVGNLNITSSNGAPGSGSSFNIRGTTSINGGSPLVLVDGVQMDPNLISPEDVESISVLKDAASASIYGARAAYGVILITTKKGKTGEPRVSFSTNLSWNKPTKKPDYLDSWQFATMHNEVNRNSGGGDYYDENYMNHIYDYYTDPQNNLPVFVDPNNPDRYLYCGNTDWIDAVYKDVAFLQQYNASISGGMEKCDYYASVGMMDQGGILKYYDDSYRRINTNLNINSRINEYIKLGFRSMYNNTNRSFPYGNNWTGDSHGFVGGDLRPLMPVFHPDGNFSGQGNWTNQAALQALSGDRKNKVNDMWLGANAVITPIKGFNINFDYTFNYYNSVNKQHGKLIKEYTANPNLQLIYPWTSPNKVAMSQSDNYYHVVNLYGDYEFKIREKNNFKVLLGYNQEYKRDRWFSAERQNLINNDMGQINQATGNQYVGGGETDWAISSVFARINYNFDDRYLFELNGRYDGSSKFPTNDRFGFFPSGSLAWRVSGEEFFEPLTSWFTDLKLRGSYGQLGNQSVGGNYPYIPTLGTSTNIGYLIGGERPVAVNPAGLVSSTLTWERVDQTNIGIDLGFFDNRLTGSFDWFQRYTKDMVTSGVPLPGVLGTSVPQENAADLRTRGFELTLGWQTAVNNDFRYNVNFILSDYHAEITKFDNPNGLLNTYYVGQKLGSIWGYTTDGLFQSEEEIQSHASQKKLYGGTWYPGDVKYKDLNNDGEISNGKNTLSDPGDLSIIGNSTPRYNYGIKGGITWKSFDLDIFFQGVAKRDFMAGGGHFWGFQSEWDVPLKHSLDYWREDNKDAFWHRPSYNNGGNRQTQTRYMQSAAYLRLKQLTLGYTLPSSILSKVGVDNFRVYLTGQNLFEISNIMNIYDPETLSTGAYPLQRSISVGVNLMF
ncbi:MAG TPA: SusC/RagA family TonB-linked outer membrane protein [Porphyromonadaceae bacterium]|nr:SusC/RagA family TonB-linked outer membrane protein [Porphyromonadaceae bacterium]